MHKQKYLDILATGIFSKFSPAQLEALHAEVAGFLGAHAEALDASELFDVYELQFHVLLLTNRDVEAKSYLDRINDQFAGQGPSQKIMILRLMYHEATGDTKAALAALGNNPDELRASRRLATFSRTNADGSKNWAEYAKSLNYYLNLQPADVQAWAELGDVYGKLGHYDKAVFCWKEVLLHRPTAYNAFARVGILHYSLHLYLLLKILEKKDTLFEVLDAVEAARDVFLRAVEISESCTDAWLGLLLLSKSAFLPAAAAYKRLASLPRMVRVKSDLESLAPLALRMVIKHEGLRASELDSIVQAAVDQATSNGPVKPSEKANDKANAKL